MSTQESIQRPINKLRLVGALEGISFVILMLVGLPMKYMMAQPMVVKVAGPVHGALFVWLCYELATLVFSGRWLAKRAAVVFGASLLPFGPFAIDHWLKKQRLLSEEDGALS